MLVPLLALLLAAGQQSPVLPDSALPNDNRVAAGVTRGGVLHVGLVAREARWRPDLDVDSMVRVQAFAEEGRAPTVPGPLLRASAGTEVRVTLRNALDSTLLVRGLRAGAYASDTIRLGPRETREVRFVARTPGTYLYWATTTPSPVIADRPWRDAQLTGALVVDPAGARPDPRERILVMTVIDLYKDDTLRNKAKEDVWELAINGRSWPHTERLAYQVGDTVRWRWLNGTYLPHPMHLHGFHFDVTAHGEDNADTTYARQAERTVVTELMVPGSTFGMRWVPTRAGHWLMHCHMRPHVTPFPERPDSVRHADHHDVEGHARRAMSGLVLGVTVTERAGAVVAQAAKPTRTVRLLAQQARAHGAAPAPRSYVVQQGREAPPADSIVVPGAPLVLTRGETAAITVVNRLAEHTTVHWHGMELESVFDGVSGWSRTRGSVAPLVAPGDSFTVTMTPPRAGTFIYHTHMDEGLQLAGLYGPLLVLEPGERWDPARDRVFMVGHAIERDSMRTTLDGRTAPPPLELRANTTYRLRLVNIHSAGAATVELREDTTRLAWTPLAKDGADLPPARRVEAPSRLRRFGVGETYDFAWTPLRPMTATLEVRIEGHVLRRELRVRE